MTTMSLALGDSTGDATRRSALRRMKLVATALFVGAAALFVATHGHGGPWGYVNAAAEAAMVGALADWFAVTALFRHPLGIPIPHTALIPRKKDQLAASLQDFVAENFLSEGVIRDRLVAVEPAQRLGAWLTVPGRADSLAREGSAVAADLLGRVREADVQGVVTEMIVPRMIAEPLSPAVGELLREVIDEAAHTGLVDIGLDELGAWLRRHPERLTDLIKQRAPDWAPDWANNLVADRLLREVLRWVEDIRTNPHHDARRALDHWLTQLADDLQHDPATMERAERLKERLLTQPQAATTAVRLWDAFRAGLVVALRDDTGLLRRRVVEELTELGATLQSDPVVIERVNRWVADAAAYVVNHYGSDVASVISSTVERWDGTETGERIELFVGRDLQFIRINGTIVGGLAGLTIHALSQFL